MLVNTEGKLKKLERLNTFKPNFGFVCATYVYCQNALETISNFNDHTYNKSDIVTLNADKSKCLYLTEL